MSRSSVWIGVESCHPPSDIETRDGRACLIGMNCSCFTQASRGGRYTLPALPYATDALEPFLDARTLELHHDKHHAAYVAGANAARDILQKVAGGELPETLAPAATKDLAFNLGGHILHCLYWGNMTPEKSGPPGEELTAALQASFGSYEGFVRVFRSVTLAIQGSGWGVLGLDPVSRQLMVTGICRHQDILVPGFRPLLVCDVWEHAYYLNYQNNRAGYIDAFMNIINWKAVEKRFLHHHHA